MDKEFQLKILRICAANYPYHAGGFWSEIYVNTPGESREERERTLCAHLAALQELGYIKDFLKGHTCDGKPLINRAFYITAQGLLAAGEDILHPEPYAELRDALLEQAKALRSLSPQEEKALRSVLAALPHVALERLFDKGLDMLLTLICS